MAMSSQSARAYATIVLCTSEEREKNTSRTKVGWNGGLASGQSRVFA